MTSFERVSKTFIGEEKDRPPYILILSLYGSKLINSPLKEYYNNAQRYVEGQMAVYREFTPDIISAPFELTTLGAAFGSTMTYYTDHPPNITKHIISDISELKKIKYPDINSNRYLNYILDSIKGLRVSLPDHHPIAGIGLSPVDMGPFIIGMDNWLETILFNQSEAEKLIEMTTEFFVEWSNRMFESGMSFLVLPLPFSNLRIVTPKIMKEFTVPWLEKAFSRVKGPIVLHHGGLPINRSLKYIKDLPNTVAVAADKSDNMLKTREIMGPDKVLLGNIDGPGLYKRKSNEIINHVEFLLNKHKKDPKYIFSTSAADIDLSTPIENIKAITETIKEFRGIA